MACKQGHRTVAVSATPPDARDLLVKLCGMLGSDFEGERAAAALKITGLLRHLGWSWDQLLHWPGATTGARTPARDAAQAASAAAQRCREHWKRGGPGLSDWRADLACCRRYGAYLTDTELAYVTELVSLVESGRATLRSDDHAKLA